MAEGPGTEYERGPEIREGPETQKRKYSETPRLLLDLEGAFSSFATFYLIISCECTRRLRELPHKVPII